jgi:hypothetical protein
MFVNFGVRDFLPSWPTIKYYCFCLSYLVPKIHSENAWLKVGHDQLKVRSRSDQGRLRSDQGTLTINSRHAHGQVKVGHDQLNLRSRSAKISYCQSKVRSRLVQSTFIISSRYGHGQLTVGLIT